MISPGGELSALACHPNKRVNKSEELTYFSTNIGWTGAPKRCFSFRYAPALLVNSSLGWISLPGTNIIKDLLTQ